MSNDTTNETRSSANYRGSLNFKWLATRSLTLLIVAGLLGKGKAAMANHLPKEKQVRILQCLVEGCSIRSTSRMTGAHVKTILDLLLRVGAGCAEAHDEYAQDLDLRDLQLDEIWAFVGKKQKRVDDHDPADRDKGDAYTFTAIDRKTKFVPSWRVGKRSWSNAVAFLKDVKDRLADDCHPQVSTDGFKPYPDAVERAFGTEVDYAQIVKNYAEGDPGRGRYSPATVVDVDKRIIMGDPDEARICTSHAERNNLTIRMAMRRFTRLTNGFSKKLPNLVAAVNLHMAYYNYCRPHTTLKGITPAMAAGVADHVWSLEELLDEACPPWAEKTKKAA